VTVLFYNITTKWPRIEIADHCQSVSPAIADNRA
jgi:hypothetical protein